MRRASFTARIVAEVAPQSPGVACCRHAVVEGMALVGRDPRRLVTPRVAAARAALSALHADGIPTRSERRRRGSGVITCIAIPGPFHSSQRICCARHRLRGAFLAAGHALRPQGAPHIEIHVMQAAAVGQLGDDLTRLGIPWTHHPHGLRARWVITVRTAAGVGSFLTSIGAQSSRLDFEDGRVVRELRGDVNRRLNSETANLRRTVAAAVRQLDAIRGLRSDPARWEGLSPALRAAAELRDRHPDLPLDALSTLAGCSRSAMADRLRRLLSVAEANLPPSPRRSSAGRGRRTRRG